MTKKTLKIIVDHIFPIRKQMDINDPECDWCFDYPSYGNLPKKISNKLSPEAVDAMQYILQEKFSRKRDFSRAYKNELEYLGEKIKYSKRNKE